MLAASRLHAQQESSFEDAVMMARQGMIVRGTVVSVTTEGKDAPMPRAEAGQQLRTLRNVRIDDCYFSSGRSCAEMLGSNITISALTGMVVEREGALAYGEIITNATGPAVTSTLKIGSSYLLLILPDHAGSGTYQLIPVHNGCNLIDGDVVHIELRRYDLLSEPAKSLPANLKLAPESAPAVDDMKAPHIHNRQAHYFADTVPLRDMSNLIQRIRRTGQDAPTASPLTPN
jgi:hypothetical protein